jgi:queuosine precursor transporter
MSEMALRIVSVAGFAITIPLANWLIGNVGTACVPAGPCLVPMAPGLMATSGVLVIGIALVLRDAVHELGGVRLATIAIALGAALSWLVAPPAMVLASVVAFTLGEAADLAVYAPLRKRGRGVAVLASGLAGAVVDSALFLVLAFGSLDYMAGQVVGKLWATVIAAWVIAARRRAWS